VVSDQVSGATKWFLIRFQEQRSGFRSSLFVNKIGLIKLVKSLF
jgi:hypothetical protein